MNNSSAFEIFLKNFQSFQEDINSKLTKLDDKINSVSNKESNPIETNVILNKINFDRNKLKITKIYDKMARYKNHVNMFETHLKNETTPPTLFYTEFPIPFLQDDEEFVFEYNGLIKEFQTKSMLLCKKTLIERIDNCVEELSILKSNSEGIENIGEKFEFIETKVNKDLEPEFKIKHEQVLRARSIPYEVGIVGENMVLGTQKYKNKNKNGTKFKNSRQQPNINSRYHNYNQNNNGNNGNYNRNYRHNKPFYKRRHYNTKENQNQPIQEQNLT